MRDKRYFALALFFNTVLQAQDLPQDRALQTLGYKVSAVDQELSLLRQRIQNQELVLDSMHKEVSNLIKAAKESQSKALSSSDSRLKAMEKTLENLVRDLKQFKTHANDTASHMSELQKSFHKFEETTKLQAEQIKDLESAMRTLAQAMQLSKKKEIYKVKSGDTLEKIAKKYNTSVEVIKSENDLANSTIYSGQELVIPQ
jgi:LysM repeat protein